MARRVVVILLMLSLICCRKGPGEKKISYGEYSEITNTTLIFDGKSLNGWEITNFGQQGPVAVSGGRIILGMGDGCTGITWKIDFPEINFVKLNCRNLLA